MKLWVKGFDIRRRDIIFYAVLFIWPPFWAAPIGRKFASSLQAPKVDPSRLVSSTQLWLSSDSPQTSARFRCVTSLTLRHPFCLGVLWHLSDTSIRPCSPALTPASMLHPTNPCAEPNGSQPDLTQRHEPKSLGYYKKLSDPQLSSPARMRKKCCYGQKNFGSICSSLSRSPNHLSHTWNITLLRIKCERYIFYKEVCSFVHWSLYIMLTMFLLIFVYVLWVYTKGKTQQFASLFYIYIYIYILNRNLIFVIGSTLYWALSVIVALQHFMVDFSFSFDQLIAYLLIFFTWCDEVGLFFFFCPMIFFLFPPGGNSRYYYL